jgi:hypothetical protein
MTPAQASGHPNFVTDVPVQGPTDEGMRAADCWQAQNRLPAKPACVDCDGPIPAWARTADVGISFGGVGVRGFALGAAGDPEIYSKLTADQQAWVGAAFSKLNDLIVQKTGTKCSSWAPAIGPASTCFQGWYNAAPEGRAAPLRTDGVFDESTLCALLKIVGSDPTNFPASFPDPTKQHCQPATAPAPAPAAAAAPAPTAPTPTPPAAAAPAAITSAAPAPAKGFSTGAKIGIGAVGAATLGGIIYAASRKRNPKRRREGQ